MKISVFIFFNFCFLIGLTQTSSYSKPHNYDQPLYTPDFKLVERALSEKQNIYNERKKSLQMKIEGVSKLVTRVSQKNGGLTQSQSDYVNYVNTNLNSYVTFDFSVYENYSNVYNWLDRVENEIYTWL